VCCVLPCHVARTVRPALPLGFGTNLVSLICVHTNEHAILQDTTCANAWLTAAPCWCCSWQQGKCRFGPGCKYAHGEQELRELSSEAAVLQEQLFGKKQQQQGELSAWVLTALDCGVRPSFLLLSPAG
jgi:hypothetical protein